MSSRPIRILHVVTSLEAGGMENGVANLARGLQPTGFSTHVCCLERAGAFAERLPGTVGLSVLGKGPGFSLQTVFALARVIGRLRPDLIHSHNLGPLIYGGLAACGGVWRPILHGEHAELNPEELSPRRLRQRSFFYRCCRRIHTVSNSLRDHLQRLGFPGRKLEVVVNGVDTIRFTPASREAARRHLNLPAAGTIVGIVGRFGPFKQHTLLIDAFARVARHRPDLHLLVVGGGGSERDRVTQQARTSEAAERIHLVGFQSEAAPCYQAMNLLVVPSTNEGLSNALLEGMASGIPALCHDACGNREVVSHGEDGLVFDLRSAEDLAARLDEAVADLPRLNEMGRQARAKMLAHYSLEVMVQNYARLYRELVTNP